MTPIGNDVVFLLVVAFTAAGFLFGCIVGYTAHKSGQV